MGVAGATIYSLITELSEFGKDMENAGAGFRETMTEVGQNLGGVPLIGSGIRTPFDGASDAGGALRRLGRVSRSSFINSRSRSAWASPCCRSS